MESPDVDQPVPLPPPIAPTAQPAKDRPFPLGPIFSGFLVIATFIGCITAWSMLAPIESAVISPGVVSVSGSRKTIQHLEGGIVEEILIDDGDHVRRGDLLVKLRDVRPNAEATQLQQQHAETRSIIARLLAERDGASGITFPDDLLTMALRDPSIELTLRGQSNVFKTRRRNNRDRQSVLTQKVEQAKALIVGLEGQITAVEKQLKLASDEHSEIAPLVDKSLIPGPRLRELGTKIAEFEGLLSEHRGDIAREEQKILETQLLMSELKTSTIASVTEQLRTERARSTELSQQIIAAEDVLRRTEIRSPIDGVVVNLQIHTRDGVVSAGQALLEVVPIDDDLVIDAYVNPEDIDEVRTGLPAHVQLTSLNRRHREPIEGVVSDVSADRLTDASSGRAYYRARIQLDAEAIHAMGDTLLAGMGADVFIRTGARTPFDYLLQPITRNLKLGLREN
ncbi:MAG: HlyD family type I secretion periplasmic adaptor subunit [Geminicoccaceae bacterium]